MFLKIFSPLAFTRVKASTSTRGPLVTPSPTLPPGLDLGRALSTCCRPPTRPVKRQKQLRPYNYRDFFTIGKFPKVLAGIQVVSCAATPLTLRVASQVVSCAARPLTLRVARQVVCCQGLLIVSHC